MRVESDEIPRTVTNMRILVPLAALILFLHMDGSLPDAAQAEYLLRGWWPNWQMQMRMWHLQEYSLWGGVLLAAFATLRTLTRAK